MPDTHHEVRTDSQGRCLTCEGSGVYIGDDGFPMDCLDCEGQGVA